MNLKINLSNLSIIANGITVVSQSLPNQTLEYPTGVSGRNFYMFTTSNNNQQDLSEQLENMTVSIPPVDSDFTFANNPSLSASRITLPGSFGSIETSLIDKNGVETIADRSGIHYRGSAIDKTTLSRMIFLYQDAVESLGTPEIGPAGKENHGSVLRANVNETNYSTGQLRYQIFGGIGKNFTGYVAMLGEAGLPKQFGWVGFSGSGRLDLVLPFEIS